jgi:hypothetical protein
MQRERLAPACALIFNTLTASIIGVIADRLATYYTKTLHTVLYASHLLIRCIDYGVVLNFAGNAKTLLCFDPLCPYHPCCAVQEQFLVGLPWPPRGRLDDTRQHLAFTNRLVRIAIESATTDISCARAHDTAVTTAQCYWPFHIHAKVRSPLRRAAHR